MTDPSTIKAATTDTSDTDEASTPQPPSGAVAQESAVITHGPERRSGPGRFAQRLVVFGFLASLIVIAHAHRPGIEVSPEARVARRYQAQVSDLVAYQPDRVGELNLTLEDAQGNQSTLSQFHGQVVLLNFWASWCAPCIQEMPDLEELAREMKGLPFSLVALSSDDDWGAIHKVTGQRALNMKIYRDPQGSKKQQMIYGTEKLPETYVIDKQGRIRLRFINVQPWKDEGIRGYLEWLAQE